MKKFVRRFFVVIVLAVIAAYIYFRFFVPDLSKDFAYKGLEQFYPEIQQEESAYVEHQAYHLSYNEEHEQANWVIYLITRQQLEGPQEERQSYFTLDDAVETGSASSTDYTNSGYDRGHLAPAAAMAFNEEVMGQSFYMSNVSPQKPGFNRGKWKELESLVRNWAVKEDSLIVVTGPVFKEGQPRIGKNQVTVPAAFFKVVMDISQPDIKTIAFMMPHADTDNSLIEYALSVDDLEAKTGYDFFARFPKKAIEPLEKMADISAWAFPSQ